MVGIVVVSHSEALADGVVRLAREMAGDELALEAAGGIEDTDPAHPVLGTDAERVRAAIERAMSPDGVLVMMDLGSALMSAEFAVELVGDAPGRVLLSAAPLVEGAVAAAVAAAGGASLDAVAAEARGALAMKAEQLGEGGSETGAGAPGAGAESPPSGGGQPFTADARAELPVLAAVGLHARPAARFVAAARSFDAELRVAKRGGGPAVEAASLTAVLGLGARFGDTLEVSAAGPQAGGAIQALRELAATGFGDGVASGVEGRDELLPKIPRNSSRGRVQAPAPAPGAVLTGVTAGAGVKAGPAHRLDAMAPPPADRPAGNPADERQLLSDAIAAARTALERDRETIARRAGRAEAAIFDAHLALLDDPALLSPARAAIAAGAAAERAWHEATRQVAGIYRGMPEPLLRERATDVIDVGNRVLAAIAGAGPAPDAAAPAGWIAVADELTPAGAAQLDPAHVVAIATARGSATAHAAILARGLGLPAVVGLGDALLAIPEGTELLLDGDAGTVTVAPGAALLEAARARSERRRARLAAARVHAGEPAITRDGQLIEVAANIGSAQDAEHAVAAGADGVGLLRTEFLYLGRDELPGEEEQAGTLRRIAAALEGRPLIVRTLDAGADKPLPAVPMDPEANPFLGLRGIRLTLARPELLATQLRAILRVAAEYPLKAMLPMVATVGELHAARALLAHARADTGIAVPLELGIMVEVPAAALCAARLAAHADFFSIGTNDLTQYTMAAERGDARLAPLLGGIQPAVLALVRHTVQAAAAHGRWVGVCGELAGDPAAAVLLAGLGVRELSMAGGLIAEVKATLREVDLGRAHEAARAAMEAVDARGARELALALLDEQAPDTSQ